jgi:hypothetical protein
VKECLENPPSGEAASGPDAPTPDAEAESSIPVGEVAPCKKGKVLLAEGDPSLRESIRNCLVENGYSVVVVQNSRDGMKEMLGNDFTLVLYDPTICGLSVDMFYNAVIRINPALRERFVFLSCDRPEPGTNDFITHIDGFVLQKPFEMTSLLDVVAFTEARSPIPAETDCTTADPVNPLLAPAADALPAATTHVLKARSEASVSTGTHAPAPAPDSSPVPDAAAAIPERKGPSAPPAVAEQKPRADSLPVTLAIVGLALLLIVMAALLNQYWDAQDRIAGTLAKHRTLEAELAAVQPELQQARELQSRIQAIRNPTGAISSEQAQARWSPPLRSVMACAGPDIKVSEVRAKEEPGDARTWTLLVSGVSTGRAPRKVADSYRLALQRDLDQIFQRSVNIQLTEFEEAPDPTPAAAAERHGRFTILATVRFADPGATQGKAGP